jgi:hypothetical protein
LSIAVVRKLDLPKFTGTGTFLIFAQAPFATEDNSSIACGDKLYNKRYEVIDAPEPEATHLA